MQTDKEFWGEADTITAQGDTFAAQLAEERKAPRTELTPEELCRLEERVGSPIVRDGKAIPLRQHLTVAEEAAQARRDGGECAHETTRDYQHGIRCTGCGEEIELW